MKLLCIALPILSLTSVAHGKLRGGRWRRRGGGRLLWGNGEDSWTEDAYGPYASSGAAYGGNGGSGGRGGNAQSGQAYGPFGSKGKAVMGRDGQNNQWAICNGPRCAYGNYGGGYEEQYIGRPEGGYGGGQQDPDSYQYQDPEEIVIEEDSDDEALMANPTLPPVSTEPPALTSNENNPSIEQEQDEAFVIENPTDLSQPDDVPMSEDSNDNEIMAPTTPTVSTASPVFISNENGQDQTLERKAVAPQDEADEEVILNENDPEQPLELDHILPEGTEQSAIRMRDIDTSGSEYLPTHTWVPVLAVAIVSYVGGHF